MTTITASFNNSQQKALTLFTELLTIEEESGAAFSDCRKYRYALWRVWDAKLPLIMFIGLNPSTANENTDDATIRRVKSFAKMWGYGGVYMCNCFPFISTNPEDLKDFGNTATNDFWLYNTSKKVNEIVFAWGNFDVVIDTGRDCELMSMFPKAKTLMINKNGSPRHPLYVSSKTKLVDFKPTSEPIPITFSQALHAQDEITAEQYETERQIIEEEHERILRHGDQGAFENG